MSAVPYLVPCAPFFSTLFCDRSRVCLDYGAVSYINAMQCLMPFSPLFKALFCGRSRVCLACRAVSCISFMNLCNAWCPSPHCSRTSICGRSHVYQDCCAVPCFCTSVLYHSSTLSSLKRRCAVACVSVRTTVLFLAFGGYVFHSSLPWKEFACGVVCSSFESVLLCLALLQS